HEIREVGVVAHTGGRVRRPRQGDVWPSEGVADLVGENPRPVGGARTRTDDDAGTPGHRQLPVPDGHRRWHAVGPHAPHVGIDVEDDHALAFGLREAGGDVASLHHPCCREPGCVEPARSLGEDRRHAGVVRIGHPIEVDPRTLPGVTDVHLPVVRRPRRSDLKIRSDSVGGVGTTDVSAGADREGGRGRSHHGAERRHRHDAPDTGGCFWKSHASARRPRPRAIKLRGGYAGLRRRREGGDAAHRANRAPAGDRGRRLAGHRRAGSRLVRGLLTCGGSRSRSATRCRRPASRHRPPLGRAPGAARRPRRSGGPSSGVDIGGGTGNGPAGGDPSVLQAVDLVVESTDPATLVPFWSTVLGYRPEGDRLVDPWRRDPSITLAHHPEARLLRNRLHVDVVRPSDAVAAAVAELGQVPGGPSGVLVSDPDGNEADLVPGSPIPGGHAADWVAACAAMAADPTKTPQETAELVTAVARSADVAGIPMLVDVRSEGVLVDSGKDMWEAPDGPLEAFVDLAADIQAAAHGLGLAADPVRPRFVQLCLDIADLSAERSFWASVLGYEADPREGVVDIFDPRRLSPVLIFQRIDTDDVA